MEPGVRFLLAWIVPSWLVFELTPTKLPHYPLPLYPAICILAAAGLGVALPRVARWLQVGLPGVVAFALALAVAGVPVWFGGPPFIPGLVAAALVGVLATLPRIGLALLAAPLLYAAVLGWELPRLRPLWLARQVVAAIPPGTVLGSVGFSEPSLMFTAGTGTQWLLAEEGAAALADGRVGALVVGDRDMPAFEAAAASIGLAPRQLAQITGFNVSRGRFVVLTVLAR